VPRPVTIRHSLIRSFAPLVLTVALAGVVIIVVTGRFAVRTLSAALIEQTHARVEERLDAFFEPVIIETAELAADARAGVLHPDQPRDTRARLRRVVGSVPQVASAIVATAQGRETMAIRDPAAVGAEDIALSDVLVRDVYTDGTPAVLAHLTRDGTEISRAPGPADYNPAGRPWFTGAIANLASSDAPDLHWTEPYQFFTTGDFGVTLSRAVPGPRGTIIVALDVLLSDLDEFTRALTIQRGGQVYLLDEKQRVVGLPAAPEFDDPSARAAAMLQPIAAIGHRLTADAGAAYQRLLTEHGVEEWNSPYRFTSGGESYWAQGERYTIQGGLTLIPAVIVSEKDLLGPIITARWIAVAVALAAVAWALWRCLAIAKRFSAPISALAEESDRISRGAATLDHQPLTSRVLELARLSESQVEMRLAMKTLGKLERDLQVAREIQQAQLPEELPVIEGWSFAAWSDPADETGGDVYDCVLHKGKVYMFLADATGHGVGPAISATQVRAMMRMALRAGATDDATFRALNEQLREDLPAGRFVTLWAGCLKPAAATLETLSAGQAPLLYYHAAEDRFENRDASVPPLGVLDELELDGGGLADDLHPGDFYAVFSDGIYEARSPDGELFGVDRATDALRAAASGTAEDLVAAVQHAVERFAAGQPAGDDRTGIVVKRIHVRDERLFSPDR